MVSAVIVRNVLLMVVAKSVLALRRFKSATGMNTSSTKPLVLLVMASWSSWDVNNTLSFVKLPVASRCIAIPPISTGCIFPDIGSICRISLKVISRVPSFMSNLNPVTSGPVRSLLNLSACKISDA